MSRRRNQTRVRIVVVTEDLPMPGKLVDRLMFVYNADSGLLATISDSARKLLSINGCVLCSLTHSTMGEKSETRMRP
ncbi:MAG TPA: hypothetical protein VMS98_12815 [Thermoanaerobaculia bacterium]|nr:hypothetical protein [Thermoanaerobaculia bacterium]